MRENWRGRCAPLCLLLALWLCLLTGCGGRSEEITSLEQLNQPGRIIGVVSDTADDKAVEQALPKAQVKYVSDRLAAYASVSQGKMDAFVFDKRSMEIAIDGGLQGVRLLDETLGEGNQVGVGISPVSKIPDLQEKINAFLDELRADGTLDDMEQRWVVRGDETMPDIPVPQQADLRLKVGTFGAGIPYSYYAGTELTGKDVELARRFAAWLGAELELKVYDYDGLIAAAQSGDIDCIMANLFITPERAEAIPFSQPISHVAVGVLVRDTGGSAKVEDASITQFSDLRGKTVSMLTGAPFEELVRSKEPEVGQFTFYNNNPDMTLALQTGKTDAVLINNAVAALAVNRTPGIMLFPQNLQDGVFGIAFAKGNPLRDTWQAAYDTIPEADKLALWEKWTGSDESVKVLPEQDWPGTNGTVRAAVCDTLEPMSYAGEGGVLKGFDLEMILRIAKELDVHVEFTGMEFSAIMTAVQSGKAELGAGSIIATDERRESVDFLDYYPAAFVLIVRDSGSVSHSAVTSLTDLEHGRIGVTTGSIQGPQVEKQLPDAELSYFTTDVDMLNAMRAGRLDAFALAEALVKYMMTENDDLTYLDEPLGEGMQVGAVFPKTEEGQALCDQFSAFIEEIQANGVYDEMQSIWYGPDEALRVVPDLYSLTAENGTLRMAADTSFIPFVYLKDGKPVGVDVDTVVRFCKEYGYGLEVVPMDFSGIIPSVVSGKVDFACSGIAITPERAESVLFSVPIYESRSVLAVLKADSGGTDAGFLASVRESFEKTFLRESRWKLFVEGIGTTLLISVLSILLGTALGFVVFMLCRNGNPSANAVANFCVWLVQGMPAVVLLMILYYIIFAGVEISGAAVSVVGFTLLFGARVFGMVKMGVNAIDGGQLEAAYTLGYTNRRAFYRIILPQALPHFMPSYKGAITEIIKATAIVGYVAVQDLTKMGDIVRSRTFEAFFPLIAVAVIYFVLAAVLTALVNRIELRIDPRRRRREDILKGVQMK